MQHLRERWHLVVAIMAPILFAGIWAIMFQGANSNADLKAPNRLRSKLVAKLSRESAFDTIDGLANFDDLGLASASIELNMPFSYERSRLVVPRLNRVRKLLEDAQSNRRDICKRLETRFREAINSFPDAIRELEAYFASVGDRNELEPKQYLQSMTLASAAAYLLSEFEFHEAMPALAEAYSRNGSLAVHPAFLYYAMHRLALSHPRGTLSPKAIEALNDYLSQASKIPSPITETVASFRSAFSETDFRQQFAGIDLGLDKQPNLTVRTYPRLPMLKSDRAMASREVPELDSLVSKLRTFVGVAYPQATR